MMYTLKEIYYVQVVSFPDVKVGLETTLSYYYDLSLSLINTSASLYWLQL